MILHVFVKKTTTKEAPGHRYNYKDFSHKQRKWRLYELISGWNHAAGQGRRWHYSPSLELATWIAKYATEEMGGIRYRFSCLSASEGTKYNDKMHEEETIRGKRATTLGNIVLVRLHDIHTIISMNQRYRSPMIAAIIRNQICFSNLCAQFDDWINSISRYDFFKRML